MGDVRELEERMQEEAQRRGGNSSYGRQYERLIQQAKATQEEIGELGRLCEALVEAGGRALAGEGEAERARSLKGLLHGLRQGPNGVRRYTLRLLAASGSGEARAALLDLLRGESDPLGRAVIIEALAQGDHGQAPGPFETYLIDRAPEDASWLVKAAAARGPVAPRSKRALPRLIELPAYARERNASAGIPIHTIGLSGAQDAYPLGPLAAENGGRYVAR